jgi:dTDP-4-amino-4,6-dideoxygalactose transaminase
MSIAVQSKESIPSGSLSMQFPFLDLKAQYSQIRAEIQQSVTRVLDSQHFILGPEVAALEVEIAKYVGTEFAIGCASGSDALLLALMALEIGPGDEVITTPFTFVATAGSIARQQARPVFVDIDPVTFNISPEAIEAAITPRTKAIMPVHLFGQAADMDAINAIAARHHLPVIEDAAQAIGARRNGRAVGALGTVGCFSFFPSKNLGGAGDGGIITTSDSELAAKLKILRVHGSRKKYHYEMLGVNSRLDAIQAAILRVKLPRLDEWAQGRRMNARRYRELFKAAGLKRFVQAPVEDSTCLHVYNQFTIRAERRDELKQFLDASGIPTEIYYPAPLHREPAFADCPAICPQSEAAAEQVLALPIYPELTLSQQEIVVGAIAQFYQQA